jgi:hypothetical protein
MLIRRIEPDDDVSGFSCGTPEVDNYLKKHALVNSESGVSVTWVLVENDLLTAFVTLCGTAISRKDLSDELAERLPGYPLSALLVAWIGTDEDFMGEGRFKTLMRFALEEAVGMKGRTGCVGICVDALPGRESLYEPLGFRALSLAAGDAPHTRMFLEIDSVLDALEVG